MKLNRAQEFAVTKSGKNILVSAGAGTGKTRVLVERFLHFVLKGEALVTEILALTFTDKAAAEMKSRIYHRFKEMGRFQERRQLEAAAISTLHSFAARILREHPLEAAVAPDFRVIEADESDFMREQALERVFEEHCRKGTGVFDLMHVYGENAVRTGIEAIYREARHAGISVAEFLATTQPTDQPLSPVALLIEAGEEPLAKEWQRFETLAHWDWRAVEDYKAWLKPLRKQKSPWPEIKTRLKQFLDWKLDQMMPDWLERIGSLSKAFETGYENAKLEKGLLDFDDLEIRAAALFRKKTEVSERIRQVYQTQYRHILVDEFQDTSPLQLELIEALSNGDNLFLVGDYKQSIYAFRGAEPALFLEKEKNYKEGDRGVRIPLIENYRTVPDVLRWINRFFEHLWEEDVFPFEGLEPALSKDEALAGEIGVIAVNADKGEEKSHARLREAEMIAGRISELNQEGIAYGEMALLFEAMTDAPLYEYALKKAGIPYFSVSSRGFYQQPEVRDMMSLLSFLENPFADIPLAATLRSPLFQVTDDTLYWLSQAAKAEDENYSLYRGVLDFETITQLTEEERGKLRFFKETAAELRREKDKLRLTELLDLILERTGYELALAAGADSVRRLANLKKLLSMARREEVNGPVTASDFLKRVKRLELQEVRESEAQIESEASGRVVRLMTIHKSKGLEFKVVFVSDMGRASRNSSTGKIMAKTGIGAGLQVWNELGRKWEEPALWKRLKEEQARKEKEERKRLLYVAMTRAREKLFLCGIVDNEKNIADKSFYELASWMDWLNLSESETGTLDRLAPVLTDRGEDGGIIADWEQVWQRVSGKEGLDAEASSNELIVRERLKPRPLVRSRAVDLPVSAFALFKASSEAYGRVYEAGVPEAWEDSPARQEMAQDVQADAADFGTAMHALFERLNFKNPKDRVEELLEDCFGGLPPACRPEAENLLNLFTQTELFKRLQRAQRIERELPFVLRERHGMIQGVIDVLFEDDQGWHVLDYKTALGDESKVISRGYQYQIEIYAAACRQLMGKSPQSGILYFLKNQWQYVVSFNKEALDRAALDLRQTQEDILDYKNQLYSK